MIMKTFWIKTVNLLLIIFIIICYNNVILEREKDDEINKLNAEIRSTDYKYEQLKDAGENQSDSTYKDGSYDGSAKGFGGNIDVMVTVSDGKITGVDIVSANGEDGAYLSEAENIIDYIIQNNSADVDTISGATFSSTGIKNAVNKALEKAGR